MKIDLAGKWFFSLGEQGDFKDEIELPSTTDISKKGNDQRDEQPTLYLGRNYPFTGKSYYKKIVEIPQEWQGKKIQLILERTKFTRIYWDGKEVSVSYETVTPQIHKLSERVVKGKHELVIEVDNDLASYEHFPSSLYGGHQYTEHTQTNWNGIMGELYLKTVSDIHIESLDIRKNKNTNELLINMRVLNSKKAVKVDFEVEFGEEKINFTKELDEGESKISFVFAMREGIKLWDEFETNLYEVNAKIFFEGKIQDSFQQTMGFRDVEVKDKRIWINHHPVFLRGNVDCAIFPMTGVAPMREEEWLRIFGILKSYGMNHCRFHSWCPPENAFRAADQMGIYLQVEMSCFANGLYESSDAAYDPKLEAYLEHQAEEILKVYGNHPSFLMFAIGNEMIGDVEVYERLLRRLREKRPDKLYSQGSNNFLDHPKYSRADDFWVTMRTKERGHNIRASFSHNDLPLGHIQEEERQGTVVTYEEAVKDSSIPLISHEVGQYQVFPDFSEGKKYTGVTYPAILMRCKKKLEQKGMLDQAEDFFKASGKLAVECYKEDIEAILRTEGMSGFQLLSLQDFPGQGMALVGVLNSFWESKGLITDTEWRRFCNDQVILGKIERYVYEEEDEIKIEVGIYNYGKADVEEQNLKVQLSIKNEVIEEKEIKNVKAQRGKLSWLGRTVLSTKNITGPCQCNLVLKCGELMNQYPVWIYPKEVKEIAEKAYVSEKLDEKVQQALSEGRNVLVISDRLKSGIEAGFATDFWCYPMFKAACEERSVPVAPGTMGLLIDEEHPALSLFPTEYYSNWQWQQVVVHARPVILDQDKENYKIIVQVIDNFDRNHKLGLIYEKEVKGCKLVICTVDVLAHMDTPEIRQLYNSLLTYVNE